MDRYSQFEQYGDNSTINHSLTLATQSPYISVDAQQNREDEFDISALINSHKSSKVTPSGQGKRKKIQHVSLNGRFGRFLGDADVSWRDIPVFRRL